MNRLPESTQTLIVGGGVIGVCIAYYLTKRGRAVTLVEKADICAGSSHGNAGMIAVAHSIPIAAPGVLTQGLRWLLDAGSPFYIKPRPELDLLRWLWHFQAACTKARMLRGISVLLDLSVQSLALFESLAATEDLAFDFERKGLLHLYLTEKIFAKGVKDAETLQEFGVEATILDQAGVRQMEPNVNDSVIAGIFYPEPAHLRPDRFVHQLTAVAERAGAQICAHTEVLSFEKSGSRITGVTTTRGRIRAEEVVLAAGAWSSILARQVGLRLALQPAKGYSITTKRPGTCPGLPLALDERKIAVTPMGADLFRFSSTLELAGFDSSINQRRLTATRQGISEYLPGMTDLEIIEIWRGYRPASPDGLPFIGRSERISNLIFATGHGMLGLTQGPITGQLVAQIIGGEPPSIDLTPLRPERF
ncbi:MAG: FAD-dependent oxidoreductase [Anaerolineae bacterium]|nr:FAD-dependent oxidoreductase [Anaerolineae bacterium]